MFQRNRLYAALTATAAATCLVTACSTGSSSSLSPPAQGGSGASGANATASGAPGSVTVPKKTIGVLEYVQASYVQKQLADEVVRAGQALGWNVIVKDGQGQPSLMASAAESFVQQHVDAFVSIANDPSVIKSALQSFKRSGTPVVAVAGLVPDPDHLLGAIYNPSGAEEGKMAAAYLKAHVAPGATVVQENLDSLEDVKVRSDAFHAAAVADGFKVAAVHQINVANLVSDTLSSVQDQITANPGTSVIYSSIDAQFAPACTMMNSQHKSNVTIVAQYTFPATSQALRTCPQGVVIDAPMWWTGWMAMDSLAQFFAKDIPIGALNELAAHPFPYKVVTKANMPAGQPTYPFPDLGQVIYDQWKTEGFTLNALPAPTVAVSGS
jgi:ABC-type sugar transport system substrate-binding protein